MNKDNLSKIVHCKKVQQNIPRPTAAERTKQTHRWRNYSTTQEKATNS